MQFRLRTLLIVMAVVPPLLASGYWWRTEPKEIDPVKRTRTQLRFVEKVVKSYRTQAGELPPNLDALLSPRDGVKLPGWIGPYSKDSVSVVDPYTKLPTDPWGSYLQYEILDQKRSTFRVWSKGPDGLSRTDDDINAK